MSKYPEFELPWPREIAYRAKNTPSQNALTFKKRRPSPLLFAAGSFYTANERGFWDMLDIGDLHAEIRLTDPGVQCLPSAGFIKSMTDELRITTGIRSAAMPFEWIKPRDDAPSPNDLILAGNGIYNIATDELMPLTPDYFATGVPAWEYEEWASCPTWLAFLKEVLHPDFHLTLQEWFGYALTPDTTFEKIAMLVGVSRGGKGTIENVLEQLIGEAHRASSTLNDLAGDFGLQAMTDKKLVVIPDATDTEAAKRGAASERIKSISGNDRLTINRKNMAALASVHIPAKLMFLANRHPKFIDDSSALANRELVFAFLKSFAGREDTTLRDRLSAEISGIANWAIEGLKRLREQGAFTVSERGKAAQNQVRLAQSPALRFAADCLIVTDKHHDIVPLTHAFVAYEGWADSESLRSGERRNRNDFKEDLMAALQSRGVRYASDQVRWHDPFKSVRGSGERIKGRFHGVKLKRQIVT